MQIHLKTLQVNKNEILKNVQIIPQEVGKNKTGKTDNKQKTKNKPIDLSSNTSIITLNINALSIIKGQKLAGFCPKNMTQLYAVYKTHFKCNNISRLKVTGWKKIYQANSNQWKAPWYLILISDKVDFR